MAAAKKTTAKETRVLEIPPLDRRKGRLTVKGLSPLVVHSMTAKARKDMLDKKEHVKSVRQPCDWRREYLESFYWMDDLEFLHVITDYKHDPIKDKSFARELEEAISNGMESAKTARFGVPSTAVKHAIVRGAKGIEGLDMTSTRGLLYIDGEFSAPAQMELIQIQSSGPPRVLESVISVKSGARDLRWRPMWTDWVLEFDIEYESEVFTPETIANLACRGGSRCGICEGRPHKTSLGWGRFDVAGFVAEE